MILIYNSLSQINYTYIDTKLFLQFENKTLYTAIKIPEYKVENFNYKLRNTKLINQPYYT